jgi:hypothetical protein
MKLTGLLLALIACASDTRSPEPRDPGDPAHHPGQTMHVTLTASAPRQDIALSALAAAPATLTLAITAIDNPSSQAFSLGASVVWSAAGAPAIEEAIGSVTPYPASQPGSFALGVAEAASKALARGDGQLALRVSLLPIDADRALAEPLRVTLGDPVWR